MAAENSKKEVHQILWEETANFCFKQRKEEWSTFTKLFNNDNNPKTAYEFLSSSGLADEKEPSHLAIIFHNCPSLDKWLIGKELGRRRKDVLVCFLNYFAFGGMDLLSALRELLPMFGVRGEHHHIDIIFEAFAIRYTSCNPDFLGPLKKEKEKETENPAAVAYQLIYSIILLDTDNNNTRTKRKKMTLDSFLSYNCGCGAPDQMLVDIFHSVKREPLSFERGRIGKNVKGAGREREREERKGGEGEGEERKGGEGRIDEGEIASPAKRGFFSCWMGWV